MIFQIEADGFRSLNNFSLRLRPGLNVLVGPNGAGKTNILELFEFIRHIADSSLRDAILSAGGVSGVFPAAKFRSSYRGQPLTLRILGATTLPDLSPQCDIDKIDEDDVEEAIIAYDYGFTLQYDSSHRPSLTSQHLRIFRHAFPSDLDGDTRDYTRDQETRDDGDLFLDVHQLPDSSFKITFLDTTNCFPLNVPGDCKDDTIAAFIEESVNGSGWLRDSLIHRMSSSMMAVHAVLRDMSIGNKLALDPGIIRNGDDLALDPTIKSNGAGTARVLYALFQGQYQNISKTTCRAIFGEIQDELHLAVDSISGCRTRVNRPAGRIELMFNYSPSENTNVPLPAASASDGTLKWLSLVTCLKTQHVSSIEEPENFLHPWMQTRLVNLIRERCREEFAYQVLISSHSESLLNAVKPNEIIVVSLENGQTIASRHPNPNRIEQAIQETGFGLGFLYATNALDHVQD